MSATEQALQQIDRALGLIALLTQLEAENIRLKRELATVSR